MRLSVLIDGKGLVVLHHHKDCVGLLELLPILDVKGDGSRGLSGDTDVWAPHRPVGNHVEGENGESTVPTAEVEAHVGIGIVELPLEQSIVLEIVPVCEARRVRLPGRVLLAIHVQVNLLYI